MKNKWMVGVFLLLACPTWMNGKDVLEFGNKNSERKHVLADSLTEAYVGGLKQPARRILPREETDWRGGWLRFNMNVDSERQNYFTVRCWGGEADRCMVLLFIEGKQVGYRHLGDYDLLHFGNGEAPCPGRFYYITLPLPMQYTKGKKSVELEIRAYGSTWGYGETFERYQKNMEESTVGFYKAYVDTTSCIMPDKKEVQGYYEVSKAPVRPSPGPEVLDRLKEVLSARINRILEKKQPLGQQEVWMLADASCVKWTPAYRHPEVLEKVRLSIDSHSLRCMENPELIYKDGSVYNGEWMTTCLLARSIRTLWADLKDSLETDIVDGVSRREAWSRMMKASLEFGITHRRHYTNQSMIIDMAIYECNRAMMLMNPREALPEYQTLRYLYESLALAPWWGKETPNGPEKPLGENYWQLTEKCLTKELGYVGYYGEVVDWVIQIYEATSVPGVPFSGDAKIKDQLLRIAGARYNFRYPAVDDEGYRCFRAETEVGWRDGGHYPGDVLYGDRGTAWDATPLMTAAATLDPLAVGIARQMMDDNQLFAMVEQKLKDGNNIRSLQSCLHIPEQYELVASQPASGLRLPMSADMPDYVFADEEDGVVAIKNEDEILYVSLYWRARNAVNNLAKVHYITPVMERLANVYIETKFEDSGMRYTRPDWVNLGFAGWREWYTGVHSAHAGEVLPIAKIPEGISFKPGEENAYAGRADYYLLKFGPYVVAMNSSTNKSFELEIPQAKHRVLDLTKGKYEVKEKKMVINSRTTRVFFCE